MAIPEDKLQQLKDIAYVMDACGAPKEILTARLRKIIAALGLPKDAIGEVKKLFTSVGFKVLNVAEGLSAVTLLPPQSAINSFNTACEQLRVYMAGDKGRLDPKSGIMKRVYDLYEFLAAYKDDDLGEADRYRSSSNYTGIYAEFGKIVNDCSGARANAYPYRYYLEMAQAAQKLVNPADGSAVKYARNCRLEKLKKENPFLTKLAPIPENIKLEPWFAKECLATLQQAFSEDEAIAFYNFLAVLNETPYEKESTAVTVVCPGCKSVHTFTDLKTAQHSKCTCGLPLFRQCPGCDHVWPAVETYCRECGMNMDAVRNFPIHYQNAENALRASDPIKAREEFDAAKLCNPKETQKLQVLNEKITKLEKTLGEPIGKIKALIAGKQLNAASAAIAAMSRDFPGVDLSKFSEAVNKDLAWARQETSKIADLPSDQVVQVCMFVMQRVADDPVAMSELRKYRPNPVQDVVIQVLPGGKGCAISWKPAPKDVGVSYAVVRKETTGAPAHINDGEVVARDVQSFNARDERLKPGVNYYYSVFACRGGMESAPASIAAPILLLPDLADFELSGMDGKCMLSWQNIPGSQGVRILRDGKVLEQCVSSGSYVDEDVDDGDDLVYSLQTVWRVGSAVRYSMGIRKDITVEETPDAISIKGSIQNGVCSVQWAKPATNRNVILLKLNPNQTVPPKTVYTVGQLSKMGTALKNVSSAAGGFSWGVQDNVHIRLVAFVQFGDNVISSNTQILTNIEGCKIDQDRTCIENGQLQLRITHVPEKATRIAYSVSTRGFADYDQVESLNSVEKSKWHMIRGSTDGKDLYVSVFAVYEEDERKIFSAPENCLVPAAGKASVKYRVNWGGFLKNKISGATLRVTVEDGKEIPAMTLYGSRSGKPIIGNFNKDLVAVCHVPAQEGTSCTVEMDEKALKQLPRKTELKLMMDTPCGSRYNLPEAYNGTNIVP